MQFLPLEWDRELLIERGSWRAAAIMCHLSLLPFSSCCFVELLLFLFLLFYSTLRDWGSEGLHGVGYDGYRH